MSKPNKYCKNKEWLYDQYINQGKSSGEIAEELGCGASTVQHWLRRHEISIRDSSSCHMESTLAQQCLSNEEWLRDQYLVQMKSATKISEELSCQQETVSKYLHKYNIKIRTQSEEISGERHPLYGKHHTEKTKQILSERFTGKKRTLTEEQHLLLSEKLSGPGNPRYGVKLAPKQIEKQKCSISEYYKNKENYKRHKELVLRGEKHPSWKGGISFEPYCPKFNKDLKERVRAYFGFCCMICGKTEEENGRALSVHHVEYDKKACCDGKPVQFSALCHHCHSKTNFDRERWESMLHRVILEIYNGRSYYTKEEYKKLKT